MAKQKAMHADMTDAQLLEFRPAGQSDAKAATTTWLWRTRERIAGRDPMRSSATKSAKEVITPMPTFDAKTLKGVSPELANLIAGLVNETASLKAQLATRPTGRANLATKAISDAPAHVQQILAQPDDELLQLEQLVKRGSKVSMIKRSAAHSTDALQTYICGGGKAARAFMKGEGAALLERTDMGLVPGLATHNYASKMLQRITDTSTTPAGKAKGVRGSTASQATKRAASNNPNGGLDK